MNGHLDRWLWGEGVRGFKRVRCGKKVWVLAQADLDAYSLAAKIFEPPSEKDTPSPYAGRGLLRLIPVERGDAALVRTYRRGGVPGCFTKDLFFTWPARPFRELAVTERVRSRGVPTLEVLAALVEREWGPFYRGWLVTRRLGGAKDLWLTLQNDHDMVSRKELFLSVARSLRRMHELGIYHSDLNLKNILVRREGEGLKIYVIDFDKAKLFPRGLPRERANENLDRLLRSVRKLDPRRRFFSQEDWTLFMEMYCQDS